MSWNVEEICCYSDSIEKPWANAGVKNSEMSKIMTDKNIYKISGSPSLYKIQKITLCGTAKFYVTEK